MTIPPSFEATTSVLVSSISYYDVFLVSITPQSICCVWGSPCVRSAGRPGELNALPEGQVQHRLPLPLQTGPPAQAALHQRGLPGTLRCQKK